MAKNSLVYLLGLVLAFLLAQVLFLLGFFPITLESLESKTNDNLQQPTNIDNVDLHVPQQVYNRTILMLVDALRYDFTKSGHMEFTESNACFKMQLKVDVPTVTMPRLKSLTTGTISNFLDIVLNVGQTDKLDDSLLHRLKVAGHKIVLTGDHTWLKLHPHEFFRSQANVQSFFVNDFYETDEIVTKAIKGELQHSDWSFLIAHYLGLDHIGHVEGTSSLKMPDKLREMDNVVKEITQNSNSSRHQLLLVTADHGMRNGGGHGGSSHEETHVPLYVFKHQCSSSKDKVAVEYNQIDVAATLAVINGVQIPPHSIGCLIPELLLDLPLEDQLYAYYYNALHLLNRAKHHVGDVTNEDYYNWFIAGKTTHKHFLATKRTAAGSSVYSFENAKHNYQRTAQEISALMSKSLVRFDFGLIMTAMLLVSSICIYIIISALLIKTINIHVAPKSIIFSMTVATMIYVSCCILKIFTSHPLKCALLIFPLTLAIYLLLDVVKSICLHLVQMRRFIAVQITYTAPLFAGFIFHIFSLISTSFIEEEHQTWYYMAPSILIILVVQLIRRQAREILYQKEISANGIFITILSILWKLRDSIFLLTLLPFLRRLNQTGDKWKHLQDVGDVLNQTEHKLLLSGLAFIGILFLLQQVRSLITWQQFLCLIGALSCVYCFNGLNGKLVIMMPAVLSNNIILLLFWIFYIIALVVGYRPTLTNRALTVFEARNYFLQILKTNLCCSYLLAALLHKPHNIVLLASMHLMLRQVYEICNKIIPRKQLMFSIPLERIICKAILSIFVAKMFYFYQGNSNSLASIDLNPGYIGQTQYNPMLVATFVTFNTYGAFFMSFQYWIIEILQQSEITKILNNPHAKTDEFLVYVENALTFGLALYAVLVLLPAAIYLVLMIVFRYHLFIYTVFAPKALYEFFNVLVLLLNLMSFNVILSIFNVLTC